jgi:CBS domain containing-hemolysin-like protein
MVFKIALVILAALAVGSAGMFAGAETGMYRLSRLRLRLGIQRRKLAFVMLGKSLSDSAGVLVSMLIGNNLSHYAVASIVTYLLYSSLQDEYVAEATATLITAPTLFVFAEVIPKNIFFYRADVLVPYLAPVVFVFNKVCCWCGIVPLIKFVSGGFGRLTGTAAAPKMFIPAVPSHHIRTILHDIREEGIFSPVQTDIMSRLASVTNITVRTVMTPLRLIEMVGVNSSRSVLMEKLKRCEFTRLPVYDEHQKNIVGFVNIYEALSGSQDFTDLSSFVKPIRKIGANIGVIETINIMQVENQRIVLVTKADRSGRKRPLGIVTMKDLVEELVGELAEW